MLARCLLLKCQYEAFPIGVNKNCIHCGTPLLESNTLSAARIVVRICLVCLFLVVLGWLKE